LWQVAWDGDQVAGMVLNFINHQENLEYDRKRGYTETICVRRPWRRRGLARALIARSFQMHKELGMTEAALGVDAENPNGALRLYQSMGFQQIKRNTVYRKPLWQGAGS
jgi:ribosomal protein S18 acetylase RimI-like enzyme